MEKKYKTVKVGAGEYRELRAYAERHGFVIQSMITKAIKEFLEKKEAEDVQQLQR